jgi:hypothetical protein
MQEVDLLATAEVRQPAADPEVVKRGGPAWRIQFEHTVRSSSQPIEHRRSRRRRDADSPPAPHQSLGQARDVVRDATDTRLKQQQDMAAETARCEIPASVSHGAEPG